MEKKDTPGPKYDVDYLEGKYNKKPRCKFGKSKRAGLANKNTAFVPGPGNYTEYRTFFGKKKKGAPMVSRKRPMSAYYSNSNNPGPGKYESHKGLKKTGVKMGKAPKMKDRDYV